MKIPELRKKIEQLRGKQDQLFHEITEAEQEVKEKSRLLRCYEKAAAIVNQVGLETQKQLEYHLAEQVSLALETVFEDPYRLVVEFEEKRGKSEAFILFERRGRKASPEGSVGGGAIDVAAFSLRVAFWHMRQDIKTRNTLILDEPFKGLKGEDANKRALQLLNVVSKQNKKRGLQIIMISDERIPREDILENADRVFLVSQKKGVSAIKILK